MDDRIIAMKREYVVCMVQTVRGGGGPLVKIEEKLLWGTKFLFLESQ